MNRDKQIEEMSGDIEVVFNYGYVDFNKTAEKLIAKGYRKASKTIKAFIKHFEMYIGNCTFTMGQTNDIQYALKKATEDVLGGENEQR